MVWVCRALHAFLCVFLFMVILGGNRKLGKLFFFFLDFLGLDEGYALTLGVRGEGGV